MLMFRNTLFGYDLKNALYKGNTRAYTSVENFVNTNLAR